MIAGPQLTYLLHKLHMRVQREILHAVTSHQERLATVVDSNAKEASCLPVVHEPLQMQSSPFEDAICINAPF